MTSLEPSALAALQRDFAAALFDPELPVPASVQGAAARQRETRFAVYRNNVHASLTAALATRFPVVERIVGEEFLQAAARVFVRQHPPETPVLAEYGARFPDFLATFEPAQDLPYLADVARLEWLRTVAYHAADAAAAPLDDLASVAPQDLAAHGLRMHPAAACLASRYPIVSIWRTNTFDEQVGAVALAPETALVTRLDLTVLVTEVSPGTARLFACAAEGWPLGEAAAAAYATEPLLDLSAALALLFGSGAVARSNA